jgi:hypothetical protein
LAHGEHAVAGIKSFGKPSAVIRVDAVWDAQGQSFSFMVQMASRLTVERIFAMHLIRGQWH